VHDLVGPDGDVKGFRSLSAILVDSRPPSKGNSCVDDKVKQAKARSSRPADRQREGNGVDRCMNPGGRMQRAVLVFSHPIVLQQPIRNQVSHEGALEQSEGHVGSAGYRGENVRQSFSMKEVIRPSTGETRLKFFNGNPGRAPRNCNRVVTVLLLAAGGGFCYKT